MKQNIINKNNGWNDNNKNHWGKNNPGQDFDNVFNGFQKLLSKQVRLNQQQVMKEMNISKQET